MSPGLYWHSPRRAEPKEALCAAPCEIQSAHRSCGRRPTNCESTGHGHARAARPAEEASCGRLPGVFALHVYKPKTGRSEPLGGGWRGRPVADRSRPAFAPPPNRPDLWRFLARPGPPRLAFGLWAARSTCGDFCVLGDFLRLQRKFSSIFSEFPPLPS
jgi:hypothetical protein